MIGFPTLVWYTLQVQFHRQKFVAFSKTLYLLVRTTLLKWVIFAGVAGIAFHASALDTSLESAPNTRGVVAARAEV